MLLLRQYVLADDPGVLAHLAHTPEAVILEQLDSATEKESALGMTPCGGLGNGFHQSTALPCDLLQSALQRHTRDSLAAMLSIHEDARNTPVRERRRVLVVFTPMFDIRQFLSITPLAPALSRAVLINYQSVVSATGSDPLLLDRPVADALLAAFGMVANAPTSSVDAVVALHQLGELGPRRGIQ